MARGMIAPLSRIPLRTPVRPRPTRPLAWSEEAAPPRPAHRLPGGRAESAEAGPGRRPSAAEGLAARLEPYASVRLQLARRARNGADAHPDPRGAESAEDYLNRMGTALMALFRDTADREGFDALYALTRDSVLAWIKSLLVRGSAGLDPNELLQDTFVNVYRYPRSFRDEHAGSFRVWVRTIAGNLVRRAGSRRARVSFHALPEGLQEPADGNLNPAALAAAVDEGRILRESWTLFLLLYAEAWKELSDRDRRTLQLVEVEGRSYEDAGRELGVGRSNMKMIVFRSRKRIARRIERVLAASRLCAAGLEVA